MKGYNLSKEDRMMLKSIYIQYYFITFILLVVLIAIFLIIAYLFKSYRTGKKIEKMTYLLSKDINVESIKGYILFLEEIEIYPKEYYWNLIKAAYILAQETENLDDDIKNSLRRTILGKGIII